MKRIAVLTSVGDAPLIWTLPSMQFRQEQFQKEWKCLVSMTYAGVVAGEIHPLDAQLQ